MKCKVSKCQNKKRTRGYCSTHYGQIIRGQRKPLPDEGDFPIRKCCIDECNGFVTARNLCNKHYHRFSRYGDPLKCKFQERGSWQKTTSGYIIAFKPDHPSSNKNGYILQHRYIMEEYLGRRLFPEETVHHKNGDRADNRLENLELWASKHPGGQRVEDLLKFAREIIDLYG